MAEWKKVIVSGSSAELSSLSLDTALSVANGGTNATSFADKSVIISQDSGTDTLSAAQMNGNGELLIGGTSGPAVATLTNGNGIDISDGDGSITLAIDGTDAVTFSNNASIFSGSFSGSFEGDGSNLTGVSATSFDFDSLSGTGVTNSSVVDADLFAFSDAGTEKKITYAQLYGNIFGEVSNDATIAVGGALTLKSGIVSGSAQIDHDQTTNFDANEHFTQANITTVGTVTAGDVSAILPAGTISGSEQIQDVVGGMVTGNTETHITVTYQDGDGTLDFAVTEASTTAKGVVELATTAEVTTGTDTTRAVTPDALNDGYLGTANIVTLGTVTSGDVSAILPAGTVSGSTFSSPSQGTLRATINGVESDVDLGLQTGDSPQFTNLTVSGDLTVQGTTTTLQTTNLSIEDQFITIASGSQSATDGGFIVSKQADGAGFAVGYDTATTRWVLDADLAVNATGIVADAYLSTIEVSTSAPSAAPVYGGAGNGYGNMHVKTDTGDIYIYA